MESDRRSITMFPHLVEAIFAAAEYDHLITLRATCRSFKEMADKRLAEHIRVECTKEARFIHCNRRKLPFMKNRRRERGGYNFWRSQVRVLDLGSSTSYDGKYHDDYLEGLTGLRMIRLVGNVDSCVRKGSIAPIVTDDSISPITLVVFGDATIGFEGIPLPPVAKMVFHAPPSGWIIIYALERVPDLVLVITELAEGVVDEVIYTTVTDLAVNIFAPDRITIVINGKEDIAHYRKLIVEYQDEVRADHLDTFSVSPFTSTIVVITFSEYRAMSDPKEYRLEMGEDIVKDSGINLSCKRP